MSLLFTKYLYFRLLTLDDMLVNSVFEVLKKIHILLKLTQNNSCCSKWNNLNKTFSSERNFSFRFLGWSANVQKKKRKSTFWLFISVHFRSCTFSLFARLNKLYRHFYQGISWRKDSNTYESFQCFFYFFPTNFHIAPFCIFIKPFCTFRGTLH